MTHNDKRTITAGGLGCAFWAFVVGFAFTLEWGLAVAVIEMLFG